MGSDPRWWCKIRKITGVWIICQCVYATILGKWCYCSISGGHRTTESSGGSGEAGKPGYICMNKWVMSFRSPMNHVYCLQISCFKFCEVWPSSLITFGAWSGPIITILLPLLLSPLASVVSCVREPALVRLRLLLAELLPLVARFRPSSPSSTRLAVFLITLFIEFCRLMRVDSEGEGGVPTPTDSSNS